MPTVHLICGLPAAGKTTYSSSLKTKSNGVHFSLDRWLVTVFGSYSIETIGRDEHIRRVIACRELIWSVCQELLKRNVDVILDDGFFLKEHRIKCAEMARQNNADIMVHFLNTSKSIIEERILKRNCNLPLNNFTITPLMIEDIFQLFEAPSTNEGLKIIEIKNN